MFEDHKILIEQEPGGLSNYIKRKNKIIFFLTLFLFCIFLIYYFFISPPGHFLTTEKLEIPSGSTISESAEILKEKGVIRSKSFFVEIVRFLRGNKGVVAGRYSFTRPMNVFDVAKLLTATEYGFKTIKITIPEGLTNKEVALLLKRELIDFDEDKFIELSRDKEGYLFPDTYFFEPSMSLEKIIDMMYGNFALRHNGIKDKVESFGRGLNDVVIMASILEEEARTEETMRIIADILWRRLDAGMPLQVDASFAYIMNKGSLELSLEDLAVDSPYNTYKYKGLPPGAISNPGLKAILAAVKPIKNKYWFYLSDKEGNMHYAVTFDEHKDNKFKYLR